MAFTSIINKLEKKSKKQKHKHPNDQTTKTTPTSGISFKPSSEVKGLKFGGQFVVKSFTIRRARPLELLKLLSLPPQQPPQQTPQQHHPPSPFTNTNYTTNTNTTNSTKPPFSSTIAYIPTNFTILAHQAWHTLTLGLGTKKSKVLILVFESESMKYSIDRIWPTEIPLGEVNKKMLRGLNGCELARFKFRKGCITFYVYAVRSEGVNGFGCIDDLKVILSSVVALNDFIDHTAMLAMPNQRSITSFDYSGGGGGSGGSSDQHHHQKQYSVAMAH